jgi:hypothetical protein
MKSTRFGQGAEMSGTPDVRYRRYIAVTMTLALALALAACGNPDDTGPAVTTSEPTTAAVPHDVELAPEFASIDAWHNSEPLTLAGLRGSTVLIVFFSDT